MAEDYADFSPYNYVLGNPLRYNDPTGMVPEELWNDIEGLFNWLRKMFPKKEDTPVAHIQLDEVEVTVNQGPMTYSLVGPDIEPANGFWEHASAHAFGRERNGYSYDVNGKSIIRPIMGMPPDLGFGKPTSVLKLLKDIRAWRAAKTGSRFLRVQSILIKFFVKWGKQMIGIATSHGHGQRQPERDGDVGGKCHSQDLFSDLFQRFIMCNFVL